MIGKLLKERRENAKIKQIDLAKAIGISQQAKSFFENDINEPRISICVKLADFYGITLDKLIGRTVKKKW